MFDDNLRLETASSAVKGEQRLAATENRRRGNARHADRRSHLPPPSLASTYNSPPPAIVYPRLSPELSHAASSAPFRSTIDIVVIPFL